MRNAGGELHLEPAERMRSLARCDHGDQAGSQDHEYAEAHGEIFPAKLIDSLFERSCPVLDQELPGLTVERGTLRAATEWPLIALASAAPVCRIAT
jgi:hypothetical protein